MISKYTPSVLSFNTSLPSVMHIDLNSCFASVEQQANPLLRGKPIAVAAYTTASGCIVAPSIEAKRFGVKVGMRVKEGKLLCKDLIILPPDPWKYRCVHAKLKRLLSEYTPDITPKSIDEFVLDFKDVMSLRSKIKKTLEDTALEIKNRISREIGEWLTVSIGIGPNRFLAKLASNFHKPDGLDVIDKSNYINCYLKLKLVDLPYIKAKNASRLNGVGIYSVVDFYESPLWKLRAAFKSVDSYYWMLRLHGYEIDDVVFKRHSYGNSYAIPQSFFDIKDLSPIISKLTEKMCFRLRFAGYMARGVHLAIGYKNGSFWHKGTVFDRYLFKSADIYKKVIGLFGQSPYNFPVRNIFVSVYDLERMKNLQLNFFENVLKNENLTAAIDRINERWGDPACAGRFIITPARMFLGDKEAVLDRIAFGGIKELEEFTAQGQIL